MTPVKLIASLTQRRKRSIFLFVDLAMIPLALLGAFAVHRSTLVPMADVTENILLLLLLFAVAPFLALVLGTTDIRLKDFDIAGWGKLAVFASLMAFIGLVFSESIGLGLPPGLHIVFGLIYTALTGGARVMLLQVVREIYGRSDAITRVLIYGAGRTGMTLAAAMRSRGSIIPVGFVDDNAALAGLVVAGLPVFPGREVETAAANLRTNQVILAMPSAPAFRQNALSHRLERLGLDVQTLPAFAQLIGEAELIDQLMPVSPQILINRAQIDDPATADEHQVYSGASVLVSGAGGTIGLELCRQLVAFNPRRLVLLELSEVALYSAERELRQLSKGRTEIVSILGSVRDSGLVSRVLRSNDVDVVLHAAAYKHVPLVEANPSAGLENNALGTATFAQCARDAGVRRFVLVSSDKAVRPANMMGMSKRFAELVVQDLATRSERTLFSIVRFGNVFGSSGSVLPLFLEQIASGGPVTLTDENVTRYFMTIHEAVRLVLLAGSFAKGGEVFVLDMGEPLSILDLARRLIIASGYSVRDANNPDGDIEIVITGMRPGEKLHEELSVSSEVSGTAHPKITAVREPHLSEIETAAALRDLRETLRGRDEAALRAVARHWTCEGEEAARADTADSSGRIGAEA
ncbi:polysaccharide biosynthesis protein [Defluviimonas sp. WL0050]|uniref:Polysaccharide biosynthesis protein n=1 Tax=Albidovulum litorale TaxID=2984134 RepID=A0ABT2ZSM5_9RHOB|nr:nucleoside-diphosphate sugar epimerase/dehydratase [Defluviimonas sp. WL0050]MCV2874166.1 polysaccharide biosynthesis protein [Defluviimonas sp. WL0050]